MGIFDGLFGGGGQMQTTTGSSTTALPPGQQQQIDYLFNQAGSAFPNFGQTAGFNPTQNQAFSFGQNYAQNFDPSQANNALNFALQGPMNPYADQLVQQAQRPLIQNFQEQIIPGLRAGSIGTGSFGGSRGGIAEGIAARGLADQMGNISTGIHSNAYNTGMNTMMQGLGFAPQIAQYNQMPYNLLQNMGSQQQQQQQAQMDSPYRQLQQFRDLISGNYGGTTNTTGTQFTPSSGPGGALIGAGLGGLIGSRYGNPMGGAQLGASIGRLS